VVMRSRKRGHKGWELRSGARSWAGRNSEPGVTAQNWWAVIAAPRSQSKDWRVVALCAAASVVHSNWKRGGATGGDGVARMVERWDWRRIGGRLGRFGSGGRLLMGGWGGGEWRKEEVWLV
jgi:hypothetical protein